MADDDEAAYEREYQRGYESGYDQAEAFIERHRESGMPQVVYDRQRTLEPPSDDAYEQGDAAGWADRLDEEGWT